MLNSVQELFTTESFEMRRVVRGDMSVDLRDRHIAHVVADLSARVIRQPGTNPRGLTVTVTCETSDPSNPSPDLVVVATAPMYS